MGVNFETFHTKCNTIYIRISNSMLNVPNADADADVDVDVDVDAFEIRIQTDYFIMKMNRLFVFI